MVEISSGTLIGIGATLFLSLFGITVKVLYDISVSVANLNTNINAMNRELGAKLDSIDDSLDDIDDNTQQTNQLLARLDERTDQSDDDDDARPNGGWADQSELSQHFPEDIDESNADDSNDIPIHETEGQFPNDDAEIIEETIDRETSPIEIPDEVIEETDWEYMKYALERIQEPGTVINEDESPEDEVNDLNLSLSQELKWNQSELVVSVIIEDDGAKIIYHLSEAGIDDLISRISKFDRVVQSLSALLDQEFQIGRAHV